MQLNDIEADAQDQDRGRDFPLLDPVTGKATGITLRIVGPDSATQARARLQMGDELAEAADDKGHVSAAAREKARLNSLARCVLGWDVKEDGQSVPFTHANVLRLLRAATWVPAQVDGNPARRPAHGGQRDTRQGLGDPSPCLKLLYRTQPLPVGVGVDTIAIPLPFALQQESSASSAFRSALRCSARSCATKNAWSASMP